jgi:hypothetical protein
MCISFSSPPTTSDSSAPVTLAYPALKKINSFEVLVRPEKLEANLSA